MHRILTAMTLAALAAPAPARAQDPIGTTLATTTQVHCVFPLMAAGTWDGEEPRAEVRPAGLEVEFEGINADEGTAQMASGFGTYDIIVRYAGGYLNFIQSFLDGRLHVTTILDKETSDGRLKAMHSRHEYTEFALPGFTSSPEQYYGECTMLD